ncbi:hypothetical protein ACHHRT_03165 [Desulfurivibrio sp. D14AmB]|uniref:hypothetical protein n=1 Tax=Desulfurivibrio sp. D14AmB TaxID=3374370 RepID=UPI00376F0A43
MKKELLRLLAALILLGWLPPGQLAAGDGLGIKGSIHDFSGRTWNNEFSQDNPGEICRVCHAPHDRGLELWKGAADSGLLWNRDLSSAQYIMYSSDSLAGTIADQPVGRSKLCLGCHDDTVALNAFDGSRGNEDGEGLLGRRYIIGYLKDGGNLDLRGHHPISVQYVENSKIGTPGGLHQPEDKTWYDHSPVSQYLEFGRVECHSCHDVHNRVSVPATPLLRAGMRNGQGGAEHASLLCLTCHNK